MSAENPRLPNSEVIERLVIAAMVVDADAFLTATDLLSKDDFYAQVREELFELFAELPRLDRNLAFEAISNHPSAAKAKALGEELARCFRQQEWLPGAWSVDDYCVELRERTISRELITYGAKLATRGPTGIPNGAKFNERAEHELTKILSRRDKGGKAPETIGDVLRVVVEGAGSPDASQAVMCGTGLSDLDRMIKGVKRTRYYVIAGRPGQGKTALGMQIAREIAIQYPVLVFSYEMAAEELILRQLSAVTAIETHRMESGDLTEREHETMRSAADALSVLRMQIAPHRTRSIEELRYRARAAHRKEKLGAIVVDYVQLMTARGKWQSEDDRLGYISAELKALAIECNCAVIAMAAINRESEKRTDKRPLMSDLRKCGSLEYDANVIVGIHRPTPESAEDADESMRHVPTEAELVVLKQRDGATGIVKVRYLGKVTLFDDVTPRRHLRIV